jgi:hypothetical protein
MSSITSFVTGSTDYQSVPLYSPNEVVTYADLNKLGQRSILERDFGLSQYITSSDKGILKGLVVNGTTGFGLQITAGTGFFNAITSPVFGSPHSSICRNDAALTFDIDAPDALYPRIDLICCRASEQLSGSVTKAARDENGLYTDTFATDSMKTIQINYIKGSANSSPVKPTVNDATLDVPLAYIYVPETATDIDDCNICDVRNLLLFNGGKPFVKFIGTRNVSGSVTFDGVESNMPYMYDDTPGLWGASSYFSLFLPDGYDYWEASISSNHLEFTGENRVFVETIVEPYLVDYPGLEKKVIYLSWVDYDTTSEILPPAETPFSITINPIMYD